MSKHKTGRKPRLDRETLLAAGVAAVAATLKKPRAMSEILGGVKLRSVVAEMSRLYEQEHGQPADPPFTPSVIYKNWEDMDEYLRDVFRLMFANPEQLSEQALERDDPGWEAGLREWVAGDREQAIAAGPGYFLAFPAAPNDDMVRDVLSNVYDDFDALVVPRLQGLLKRHGLRITLPPTDDDPDGYRRLAGMLTAVTEGWFLRTIAQPGGDHDEVWIEHAIATVRGVTAPLR